MKRILLYTLLILSLSCGEENNPIGPGSSLTGMITIVFEENLDSVASSADSTNIAAKPARPAVINSLEIRVLKSDNSLLVSQTDTPSNGRFEGTIEVQAFDNLKVLCIGKNNAVIERFGIDNDVDVKPGETTEAVITGWLTPYTPYMNDITPNPSPDGAFTVTWNRPPAATISVLQEADNPQFTGARTVYTGTDASRQVSGKVSGTYYYRVSASNEYSVISGWSDPVSVKVSYAYTISGTITGADGVMVALTGDKSETQTVNDGKQYSFTVDHSGSYTVTPTKTGYNFTPPIKSFSNVTSNQSQDFTAVKQYTLTMGVNQSGGGTTTPAVGSYTYDSGTSVTVTAAPSSGYTFTGWTGSVASTSSATTTVTMSSDLTVTANFERITYTISGTVTGADGVTVTLIGDKSETQTVNSGEKYTFSVEHGGSYTVTPTKAGYKFAPESMTFSTVSSFQTQDFTASEIQKYTLTMAVNAAGWGTTTPSVGSASNAEGTVVTVTAMPASGYRFVSWSGSVASTTNATTTVTVTGNMTVTANFEEDITFVSIPGGTFQMGDVENAGSSYEKPVHTVTVSSFEMGVYEVTNSQYAKYLNEALASGDVTATSESVKGAKGTYSGKEYIYLAGYYSDYPDARCWIKYASGTFIVETGKENYPVVFVTWYGSKSFALYNGLDLPTEAEWEYACRGGKQYKYGTSDGTISTSTVNYWDTGIKHPVDVGSYPSNPFGLYDMSGNVWEWCHDWYGSYSSGSVTNPTGAQTGSSRVGRGGGWGNDDGSCRSAYRLGFYPASRSLIIGFRVVRRVSSQNY